MLPINRLRNGLELDLLMDRLDDCMICVPVRSRPCADMVMYVELSSV
jgi:hypothetical protein